jgi:alpha-1,2-mannosyltransferase
VTPPVSATADGEAPARSAQPRLALRVSLARLSVRPRSVVILTAVPVLAMIAGILGWLLDWHLGVDSAVYRAGALTLMHHEPLYDATSLTSEPYWALLPFTYPPTAALLFVPLGLIPLEVAWGVLTAISVLALALVVRIAIGSLPKPTPDMPRWWASPARSTLVLTLVFLGLEPVWRTIFLGQINLILMAMVVLDVLVICARDSRWGGVLTGVAAAVKLLPLAFVAHLVFTGRWKDALRALASFAVLQGVMFALIPQQALKYWKYTLPDTGRIGPIHWSGNQSINGFMNRVFDLAPWASKAAIGVSLLLAIPAIWLMLRLHKRGQNLAALLVTAFWLLLASPVSWSHHWVWAVPLIVLLISRLPATTPATAWKRWLGAGAVIAVFVSCALLILPNGRNIELHWKVWQDIIGNIYIEMPFALALVLMVRWWMQRREAARSPEAERAGALPGA